MKRLPIAAAKEVAKKYNQDQVIIVTLDRESNLMHTVSYGKTLKDCKEAAQGINFVRKALGFPEAQCHEKPARLVRLERRDESQTDLPKVR